MGNIVNQDTLRKYFKDTNADELISWNNTDVAKFFSSKQAILSQGIFLLDGSIIALLDNNNYEKAGYLPLDKHKNYVDVDRLPRNEAKKFKYTLCYKMVNLLHISKEKDYFVFLATRITGGKSHDKPVGERIVKDFVASVGRVKIKKLIVGRAFLDGDMIANFKKKYGIDTLIPLKKNMDAYLDAKGLSRFKDRPWKKVDETTSCLWLKR